MKKSVSRDAVLVRQMRHTGRALFLENGQIQNVSFAEQHTDGRVHQLFLELHEFGRARLRI